jgi:hypothetical protein
VTWLPVYEALLLARGIIREQLDVTQLVGRAKASAGTHAGGGAYDVLQDSDEAVQLAREMGAAAWRRGAPAFDVEHQHGVLNGCEHNAPARYQIDALRAGYNGLGRAGRGGTDTGPDYHQPLRTWRDGIEWALAQMEEDEVSWTETVSKWAPETTPNEGEQLSMAQQLNQARGYAEDAWDRTVKITKTLETQGKELAAVKKQNDALSKKLDEILTAVKA